MKNIFKSTVAAAPLVLSLVALTVPAHAQIIDSLSCPVSRSSVGAQADEIKRVYEGEKFVACEASISSDGGEIRRSVKIANTTEANCTVDLCTHSPEVAAEVEHVNADLARLKAQDAEKDAHFVARTERVLALEAARAPILDYALTHGWSFKARNDAIVKALKAAGFTDEEIRRAGYIPPAAVAPVDPKPIDPVKPVEPQPVEPTKPVEPIGVEPQPQEPGQKQETKGFGFGFRIRFGFGTRR